MRVFGELGSRGDEGRIALAGRKTVRFPRPRTKQIRALGGAARKRICFVGFAESPIHCQKSENLEGGFASFRNGEKRLLEASKSDGFSLPLGRLSGRGLGIWDWQNRERNTNCISCQILVHVVLHATSFFCKVLDFEFSVLARQNF